MNSIANTRTYIVIANKLSRAGLASTTRRRRREFLPRLSAHQFASVWAPPHRFVLLNKTCSGVRIPEERREGVFRVSAKHSPCFGLCGDAGMWHFVSTHRSPIIPRYPRGISAPPPHASRLLTLMALRLSNPCVSRKNIVAKRCRV